MLLKRFEAKTLAQALDRVRSECGADALVVETRPTPSGYLVVAARNEPLPPATRTARYDQAGRPTAPPRFCRGFAPLAQLALDFGLSARVLQAVENALLGTRVELSQAGDPALPRLCSQILGALIPTAAIEDAAGTFRVTALVGPTGVGKTTTLAKLAARARDRGESVAIITLDTYRMAAVEQLRAFADLMAVPFAVAFTATELRRLLQLYRDCDRVYIDTTGRSPRDRNAMPLLEGMLRAANARSLLCLCAGTRQRDCAIVLDAYEPLGVDAVCLTKWDETAAPGEALDLLINRGLPLSHVCVGQEVPADILLADGLQLATTAFAAEAVPA